MSSPTNRRTGRNGKVAAWYAGAGLVAAGIAASFGYFLLLPDDCSAELLVNGRKLNYEAAVKQLGLNVNASPTAQAVITERLQFYLNLSAGLCRDRRAGRISEAAYGARQREAADWYMGIERAVASGDLKSVTPDQSQALGAGISGRVSSAPEKIAEITVTTADGAILPDGATVRNGDRIRLSLKLSKSRYVHIIGVGSSGSAYRIFPSALSPRGNPVSGTLQIPDAQGRFMRISGPTGEEQLHIFLLEKADPEIDALAEIGAEPKAAATRVRGLVRLRDLFTEPSPPPSPARVRPIDVKSRFGSSAITLRFLHAD